MKTIIYRFIHFLCWVAGLWSLIGGCFCVLLASNFFLQEQTGFAKELSRCYSQCWVFLSFCVVGISFFACLHFLLILLIEHGINSFTAMNTWITQNQSQMSVKVNATELVGLVRLSQPFGPKYGRTELLDGTDPKVHSIVSRLVLGEEFGTLQLKNAWQSVVKMSLL